MRFEYPRRASFSPLYETEPLPPRVEHRDAVRGFTFGRATELFSIPRPPTPRGTDSLKTDSNSRSVRHEFLRRWSQRSPSISSGRGTPRSRRDLQNPPWCFNVKPSTCFGKVAVLSEPPLAPSPPAPVKSKPKSISQYRAYTTFSSRSANVPPTKCIHCHHCSNCSCTVAFLC